MEQLLTNILFFIFGFYVASVVITYQIKKAIKKIAVTHNINLDELESSTKVQSILVLGIEIVDSTYLIYDADNNFVCQGQSLEDVADKLLKHKNIKFAVGILNDKTYYFAEGKVQLNS